jgi:pyruvate/2-oxoglutarate/acetoin dehydrogenase E1 component
MTMLAEHPSTIFVGQAIKYPGQRAFQSFAGVPMEKRVEMPVVENFQLGYCTGLSLNGYIPISFYPRIDFLIIAMDQLINHLDKLPNMGWQPKVIIRTAVGSTKPLDPGPQHTQNHCSGLRQMLRNIPVIEIFTAKYVMESYVRALEYPGSVIVVEHMKDY